MSQAAQGQFPVISFHLKPGEAISFTRIAFELRELLLQICNLF